jgi:phosphoribosylanthranilate isomerase
MDDSITHGENSFVNQSSFRGRIKVCGMTLPAQVIALEEMGVDLAGFIFYQKSPRYIGSKISPEKMRQVKGRIGKVGVFVNMEYDELMRTVDSYRLDMVQLHGDESPRFCEKVANYVTVIKAFRLSDNDPLEWMVKPYDDTCDMYMFDTLGAGYGGTGKKFDWTVLNSFTIDKIYFLSGGIEEEDAEQLKSFSTGASAKKLFAIDINSRFEVSSGVKDMLKIRKFVDKLRS